jgi:hypothetical protein
MEMGPRTFGKLLPLSVVACLLVGNDAAAGGGEEMSALQIEEAEHDEEPVRVEDEPLRSEASPEFMSGCNAEVDDSECGQKFRRRREYCAKEYPEISMPEYKACLECCETEYSQCKTHKKYDFGRCN